MEKSWKVEKIPILQSNFVFILYRDSTAIVIDPGDALPVLKYLKEKNLTCERILITHHHHDHIDGVAEIKKTFHCPVYAPLKNRPQISEATHWVQEGESLTLEDLEIKIWEVPGHTLGHVAYWLPQTKWLFSGDVIFALGGGRLFEGTFQQMYDTLQRIKKLPDETLIFCSHDYFKANESFCKSEGYNLQGYKSVHPLQLGQEKIYNPFINSPTLANFTERRTKKNNFKI